jgi:hypothetical protein
MFKVVIYNDEGKEVHTFDGEDIIVLASKEVETDPTKQKVAEFLNGNTKRLFKLCSGTTNKLIDRLGGMPFVIEEMMKDMLEEKLKGYSENLEESKKPVNPKVS